MSPRPQRLHQILVLVVALLHPFALCRAAGEGGHTHEGKSHLLLDHHHHEDHEHAEDVAPVDHPRGSHPDGDPAHDDAEDHFAGLSTACGPGCPRPSLTGAGLALESGSELRLSGEDVRRRTSRAIPRALGPPGRSIVLLHRALLL